MTESVILVDGEDNEIGTMPKMEAHVSGKLHRAFSVFIFNNRGALLLQQRSHDKYHSGGLWTNTCCSHPRQGELTADAAHRRLAEEMGMESSLEHVFSFLYRAELAHGIIEHEYDHVFFGTTNQLPIINQEEVAAYRYVDMDELWKEIRLNPEQYTEWLKIAMGQVMECYTKYFKAYE